jgi:elongation factor P--beta-lysine ligase
MTAHEEKDADEMRLRVALNRQIKEANARTAEALDTGWSTATVLLVGAAGVVAGGIIGVMNRGK